MTNPAASARVLLVEGPDDKHVIIHLAKSNSIPEFCISDKGGIDQLLHAIEPELKAPDRQTVGILVDANDYPEDRWKALTHQLGRANVEPPSKPDPGGTVIDNTPRVGIWLMPNNGSPGESWRILLPP